MISENKKAHPSGWANDAKDSQSYGINVAYTLIPVGCLTISPLTPKEIGN